MLWCFSSGVYLYGRLLLARVLSGLATVLLTLAFWLLMVLQLLFVSRELDRALKRLRNEEKVAEKKEPSAAATEKPPVAPENEADFKKRAKAEQRKRDEARMEKANDFVQAKMKQPNASWPLRVARAFDPPAKACVDGLSSLKSGGHIGLAPIYSFTFEEDRNAAKRRFRRSRPASIACRTSSDTSCRFSWCNLKYCHLQ